MTYEPRAVRHAVWNLQRICRHRKNILFQLLLIPLLVSIWAKNRFLIKSLASFEELLTGNVIIWNYIKVAISVYICEFFIVSSFDILISRIYAVSQTDAMASYISLDSVIYKQYTIGDLLIKQNERGESVSMLTYTIFYYLFSSCLLLIQIPIEMVKLSRNSIIGLIIAFLLHFLLFFISTPKSNLLLEDYTRSKENVSTVMANESSNFEVLKTYGMSAFSVKKVKNTCKERSLARRRIKVHSAQVTFFYLQIELIFIICLFLFTDFFRANKDICTIVVFSGRFMKDVRSFLTYLTECNDSFFAYYMLNKEIEDSIGCNSVVEDASDVSSDAAVEFSDVSVPGLFKSVNIKVERGSKVAVVGKSGAGRTSFVSMLTVLNAGKNGNVLVNGKRKWSHEDLSFVHQVPYYAMGTVMKNLQYGNKLSESEVIARCKEFGLHSTFIEMDGGYKKESLAGGENISGGQRQKVSIGRALLSEASIQVFDDCMFSVNSHDQNLIIDKITKQQDKTVLMVVTNKEHLKLFDKIILLENEECRYGACDSLIASACVLL